jgi:hypothetical protein
LIACIKALLIAAVLLLLMAYFGSHVHEAAEPVASAAF